MSRKHDGTNVAVGPPQGRAQLTGSQMINKNSCSSVWEGAVSYIVV